MIKSHLGLCTYSQRNLMFRFSACPFLCPSVRIDGSPTTLMSNRLEFTCLLRSSASKIVSITKAILGKLLIFHVCIYESSTLPSANFVVEISHKANSPYYKIHLPIYMILLKFEVATYSAYTAANMHFLIILFCIIYFNHQHILRTHCAMKILKAYLVTAHTHTI